jgi:hypothetical protein
VSAPTYAHLGPLVTNVDIDEMVKGWLTAWFPFHCRWLEAERGLDQYWLAMPKTFSSVLVDDEFPDRELPAAYVTSAETLGAPAQSLDHSWMATWRVRVSNVVRGANGVDTRRLASYHEGITRRIMLGMQDSFNGEVRWLATNVAPVLDRSGAGRYLAAGVGDYGLVMDEAVQSETGPTTPDWNPYPPPTDPDAPLEDYVQVTTVTTEVRTK